ncbi:hypothetical protein F0562_031367 [Nyssa sinensis]|uniref:Uncharacterized protein n=1 Tax=Nyssa sinensis TaxID=561372 RepID=A0A5J5ATP9_9ASTE|nr:hypothetical protein F0562_031367 [Nyssa sinensis]
MEHWWLLRCSQGGGGLLAVDHKKFRLETHQTSSEWHSSLRQPRLPVYEVFYCECFCYSFVCYDLITRPLHSVSG